MESGQCGGRLVSWPASSVAAAFFFAGVLLAGGSTLLSFLSSPASLPLSWKVVGVPGWPAFSSAADNFWQDSGRRRIFRRLEISPEIFSGLEPCFLCCGFPLLYCGVWFCSSAGLLFGSVCVEGKTFEFSGGAGGVFPFRMSEFSRRRRFRGASLVVD